MRRIVVMGAGGRDFHDVNTIFRDDADVRVVAITAAQIPGIDDRTYPASLAGPLYPEGIPIVPEAHLAQIVREQDVDEVVLAYSDLAHADVMHKASIALAAGADFRLLSPAETMLRSSKPVVAVCAVRTGCGKSQTSRRIGRALLDARLKVALVRHPMPYGDLEAMRVQRFATLADIDASRPTVEEREEYEAPVRDGMVMFAGVDYAAILAAAQAEADVVVWDGGNNDTPFFAPDLMVTVVDPLRPGHETGYHPGETAMRMADVVVVGKVDSADPADVVRVEDAVRAANPRAVLVRTASPVRLDPAADGADGADGAAGIAGRRVLVIEDGPTITHGGMPYGAGTVAARAAGAAEIVDPRPYAVGSIADTYAKYPAIGPVLPAMGYGDAQLGELGATVRAALAAGAADVVVVGTPMDLSRIVDLGPAVRRVTYTSADAGTPTLDDVLRPWVDKWLERRATGQPA
ncbi:MAG: GTPase [Kineosporiaceae bacterium]